MNVASSEDAEIVEAFLEESAENLDQLDQDLVELEQRPSDPDLLARVFRTVHTIKGTSAFLGYGRLETIAHAGETLLGQLRDGSLTLNAEITTALLSLIDAFREILRRVASDGTEGESEYSVVKAELERVTGNLGSHDPLPQDVVPTQDANSNDPTAQPDTETSVRVSVEVLDTLMELTSELIVIRSQISEMDSAQDDGPLAATARQMAMITSKLQEGVMRARLQPVGVVVGKSRRIARDLATALGKSVRVEIEGETIGVDRAINEALRDPMLHLVRNAVDHGFESPDERSAAGKSPTGQLLIRVYHERGRVYVEVADDGRGIDPQKLVASAVVAGLLTQSQGEVLSDQEALELLFMPGLSTKDAVTNLSGRGVGMDVVRSNLQLIGGSIGVTSTPGMGTQFRMNVPLTLATMDTLAIWCGGQRYAIPLASVQEVIHVQAGDVTTVADDVDGTKIYRLRGHLLPAVELAQILKGPEESVQGNQVLVVLETEGKYFALIVPRVGETVEVVVSPLTHATRSVSIFTGVTILGNGQPSLILDVAGLAASAGITAVVTPEAYNPIVDIASLHSAGLLVASAQDGGKLAFRLSGVARLERFPEDDIEQVGNRDVVQYRDAILPLIRLSEVLPERRAVARSQRVRDNGIADTVVCRTSAGEVGLVVGSIDDVVAEPLQEAQPTSRRGVLACIVLENRIAELIDVETLAADAGVIGIGGEE